MDLVGIKIIVNTQRMSQTILITGASSGFGKATALKFQAEGWNVIATMRRPENEQELSQLDKVVVERLDVLDLASIDQAVQKGFERFGGIDALVNNAGYGAYGPLEAFPRENIVKQFNTNVIGLLDVTRALLPHFRSRKAGSIINISSMGGKVPFPLGSLYHGTKFAVEGISEALHYELTDLGIRVKIVEPGAIATDFGGRSFDFQNQEELTEYQPLVGTLLSSMQDLTANAAPASLVADVIYTAATDASERMRYLVGTDAEQMVTARSGMTDEAFFGMIRTTLGL